MATKRTYVLGGFAVIAVALSVAVSLFNAQVKPMPTGAPRLFKLTAPTSREVVFQRLAEDGVVRNATALNLAAQLKRMPTRYEAGTYRVNPGMELTALHRALRDPVIQRVRLREGRWIARQAPLLEESDVCTAESYIAAASRPEDFRKEFPWLPAGIKSLEGYLFPDTYDFPPESDPKLVITTQLRTFERKALPLLTDPAKLHKLVIKASIVQLEGAQNDELPKIAGVLNNRLSKNMRLEIDATVLYAQQKWEVLGPGVVRTVKSPYNTYLHAGLPPGPIGSPGLASIEAVTKPESHPYLFYVAKPDRYHLFGETYDQHRQNIRSARRMFAQQPSP